MKYIENGETVTLEMTRDDYGNLLIALGIATCSARDEKTQWAWIRFINELNAGNPSFTPYEIPEEFQTPVNP